MERQLCEPQVLTADFSKPEVRLWSCSWTLHDKRVKLMGQSASCSLTSQLSVVLTVPIRPRSRSMLPCWLWTPSRSRTVDFLTSGKWNVLPCSPHSVAQWFEMFCSDAARCSQDAETLLKLTEDVTATLSNKVSIVVFLSFVYFLLSWTLLRTDRFLHISFSFFPSFPLYSLQVSVNTELVRCLSRTARGTLPPLAAAVGGLASQEVLKAITGKFAPLQQWVGYWTWAADLISSCEMLHIDSSVAQSAPFLLQRSNANCWFPLTVSPLTGSLLLWCLVLSWCHRGCQATSVCFGRGVFAKGWSVWRTTSLHWGINVSRATQAKGLYGKDCAIHRTSL